MASFLYKRCCRLLNPRVFDANGFRVYYSSSSVASRLFPDAKQPGILCRRNQMVDRHVLMRRLETEEKKNSDIRFRNKDDPIIKVEGFKEDIEGQMPVRTKLKFLVRDYGPTVIVLHVIVSLTSLGIFYTLVSMGLPIETYISDRFASLDSTKYLATGSTFLLAYAVHKCFMPVRVLITCTTAPIVVGFLRRKGILSPHVYKK